LGDWFNLVAILELISRFAPDNAFAISLFLIVKLLPSSLSQPFNGIIADTFDRRKVMLFSDIIRVFGALIFLACRWQSTLFLIYLMVTIQSILQAMFLTARASILPQVIKDPKYLIAANTVDGLTWSVGTSIGSSLSIF
jgi:MFS family permease